MQFQPRAVTSVSVAFLLGMNLVLFVVPIPVSVSFSPNKEEAQEELVVLVSYLSDHYTPYVGWDFEGSLWMSACFVGLYTPDPAARYEYLPLLATSLPQQIAPLTYRVELKDDLKFSDGTSLTAEDVEFSYRLMLSPEVSSTARFPENYGFYSAYLSNSSIQVLSSTELEFTLTRPYPFPSRLFSAPIVPKPKYAPLYQNGTYELDDPTGALTIGAGPYRLKELNEEEIILEQNPYYVGLSPQIPYLHFKEVDRNLAIELMESGKADLLSAAFRVLPDQINTSVSSLQGVLVSQQAYYELAYNHVHPIVGTGLETPMGAEHHANASQYARYVRYAISHAIPRGEICEASAAGLARPGITPVSPSSPFFNPSLSPRSFNLSLSRHYLELAGYSYTAPHVDSDGDGRIDVPFFNLTIMVPVTANPIYSWPFRLAELLEQVGIHLTIISSNWADFFSRIFDFPFYPIPPYDNGGYDLFCIGYGIDFMWYPDQFYDSQSLVPNGYNIYNWNDSTWDTLIAEYGNLTDYDQVINKAAELQEYLYTQEITSTVLYPLDYWVYSTALRHFDALLFSIEKGNWDKLEKVPLYTSPPSETESSTSQFTTSLSSSSEPTSSFSTASSSTVEQISSLMTSENLQLFFHFNVMVVLTLLPIWKRRRQREKS